MTAPPIPGRRRIAANLFLIHLLGDIPLLLIMGGVSNWAMHRGCRRGRGEGGNFLVGLLLTVPAMLLSGLVLLPGGALT